MALSISRTIPSDRLRELGFLLGESTGVETLYPPEGSPVQFKAHVAGSWEACDRFLKIDFFADIPSLGVETFRALITYSDSKKCYRLWAFASSQEEPLYMSGNFQDGKLVFVSDPTPMVWGLQRLRYTFKPSLDGSVELLGERWEPDGYAKYCSVVFHPE